MVIINITLGILRTAYNFVLLHDKAELFLDLPNQIIKV